MNLARRVIVCIAAPMTAAVIAGAVNAMLAPDLSGGWVAFQTDDELLFSSPSSDGQVLRAAGVSLLAVVAWLLFSWWLCRERPR
jgi:hypothetical protein